MNSMAVAVCSLLFLHGQAQGLVGGAQLATDAIARAVVKIVGPRKSFCAATAIAHNTLLTAGHCLKPRSDYKVQYKDETGARSFFPVAAWKRPSRFDDQILRTTSLGADLGILKLAGTLPASAWETARRGPFA